MANSLTLGVIVVTVLDRMALCRITEQWMPRVSCAAVRATRSLLRLPSHLGHDFFNSHRPPRLFVAFAQLRQSG